MEDPDTLKLQGNKKARAGTGTTMRHACVLPPREREDTGGTQRDAPPRLRR